MFFIISSHIYLSYRQSARTVCWQSAESAVIFAVCERVEEDVEVLLNMQSLPDAVTIWYVRSKRGSCELDG